MIGTIRKFLAFCPREYRAKFYKGLVLGILMAVFRSMRIPAIAVALMGVIGGDIRAFHIATSFCLMFVSMVGEALLRSCATSFQTEAGYGTATDKRIEIAEHMRYLPMGYFNDASLGRIASVTTNTMENLQGVATRVIMLVSEGLLTTALIAVCLVAFDWRVGAILIAGCVLFFAINALMQRKSSRLSPLKVDSDAELVGEVVGYDAAVAEIELMCGVL